MLILAECLLVEPNYFESWSLLIFLGIKIFCISDRLK